MTTRGLSVIAVILAVLALLFYIVSLVMPGAGAIWGTLPLFVGLVAVLVTAIAIYPRP